MTKIIKRMFPNTVIQCKWAKSGCWEVRQGGTSDTYSFWFYIGKVYSTRYKLGGYMLAIFKMKIMIGFAELEGVSGE